MDASVAVKWYLPEPGSISAAALLAAPLVRMAPDLLAAEVGNTLWKRTQRGELRRDDARSIAAAFVSHLPLDLRPSANLLEGALEIALHFRCSVYDGLYVGLAVDEGCRLVTADDQLVRMTRGTPLEPFVQRLGEDHSTRPG
ncbi:MAG: type II toxin-antitoxin system VapC family toxin [bacterium]